ncbi:MAG: response regulator [Acidobacteriota bacterium]|jgi:two-component system phosphate regulon response regulator PhoB|nr:response regulator [Acidobacteriota bacterium]
MSDGKRTVLLVDDDEDLIEQVRMVVSREYNVDLAHSGEEALNKVGQKSYDCIVMDIMMQTLSDGLDTAKKLKENEATKAIPIVMLTSVNEHYDYRSQINESYFPNDKWLNKPVNPKEILREINALVR